MSGFITNDTVQMSKLTSFWVFLKPRTIICCMIEHNISQINEAILIMSESKNLHFCNPTVFLNIFGVIKYTWLIVELILNQVWQITLPLFLEWCPV